MNKTGGDSSVKGQLMKLMVQQTAVAAAGAKGGLPAAVAQEARVVAGKLAEITVAMADIARLKAETSRVNADTLRVQQIAAEKSTTTRIAKPK